MKSQEQKILELLMDQGWHCTNEMYQMYMADPRSRISSLKRHGYTLISRRCENINHHHHGGSKEWMLIEKSELPKEFASDKLKVLCKPEQRNLFTMSGVHEH